MSKHETAARALLGEALGIAPDAIAANASIDSEPRWSSLSHMHLIVALESYLGVTLESESMLEITSLPRITALVEHYDASCDSSNRHA